MRGPPAKTPYLGCHLFLVAFAVVWVVAMWILFA
jgi:hypothetical protein